MNEYKKIKSSQIIYKTEELLKLSNNRYRITIQIANRAKRKKYEDMETIDNPLIKPIVRAILEMLDEITQPEIVLD
uniref:DNA directed RNA polymerase subunit omega n=1 Tax=Hypnea pseudomusciformis TaxID=1545697 RepID=UPI0027DAB0FB|nr:DNA directed RNA polymerase subunit omega [Hypnea pseudomusciformis]WCH55084.1 DNA directed RNA polymerase subunit omega [Hypnea pseudomusciformis]WCH55483.1 DNA directed RNA polymerase subunit omega [Hypnea pseudomusciformis]WCH56677.1 DNA directed RNA polymerase subunit omega [Hypnea pseudomusciformis]